MPSNPELVELHQDLLFLLKTIHEICQKNAICYTLHGGTLLGAIREKGFIPWDNDADVAFSRKEYDRFIQCIQKEHFVDNISFENDHRVPRLILKREGRQTVFVDFFIYDYIVNNRWGVVLKIYGNMFLRAFIDDSVNLTAALMRKKYSPWKYRLYGFFQKVGRLLPDGVPLRLFTYYNTHFLCGKRNQIFRSNDGFQPIDKWLLPAKEMEEFKIVAFEDTQLMVHANYDEILTLFYGDYMTPKQYDDVETEAHDAMRKMM